MNVDVRILTGLRYLLEVRQVDNLPVRLLMPSFFEELLQSVEGLLAQLGVSKTGVHS